MWEVKMTDKAPWLKHGSDYNKVRDELLKLCRYQPRNLKL